MSDSPAVASPVPAAPATTKKIAKGSPKKAATKRAKPAHPPTGEMVNAAIAALKECNGSSLQAIKKYIAGTYKLDANKSATYIKKYLKFAVEKGTLNQAKSSGAAGSFKLAASKSEATKKVAKAKKPAAAKKPVTVKKPATAAKSAAKPASPKKTVKNPRRRRLR